MPNDRDIQLLKEARNSQFEEASEPKRGRVIEVNGTIFGTLPNTVWIQPLDENSSPRQVFNPGTILNLQNGSPVYYRQTPKPPAPWELVNFDLGLYAPSASTYANLFQLNVPPHASLHELRAGFPGPDSLNVHPHAVVDLSIRPTIPNSMQVRIYGGWYAASDGTYKYLAGPTNSSDLTASIPGSAGYSKIIAFLLNRLTGVVSTVAGSDYVEGTTPVYPSVTTDFILLSAVRLTNGMTAIGNRNFDREMRAIVGNTGAGGFWKDAGGGAIYYDGGDVGVGGIPERPLDFYGGSSHSGSFRIRGSTPATELVDLYVGSTGIFYVDFTNSGEVAPYLEVRPTDDEYGLKVTAPGSASAFLNIFVTDATPDVVNLTASNVGGTNGIFLYSDGDVTVDGNVDLTAGKDIFPEADGGGLFQRNVDHWQNPSTTHFNSFSGWTFATYTGFVTPATQDIATYPSVLRLANSAVEGTGRVFAYRSTFGSDIFTRVVHGAADIRTGLRMDDGTNDNYFELWITPSGGLMQLWWRKAIGGVVTGPTQLWGASAFPAQFITLRLFRGGDIVLFYYGINSPITVFLGSQAVTGWSPARSGIYHEHTSGTFSSDRVSLYDWYK